VLGEEMGGAASAPEGPCWVFDPIDGTTNFAHGLPIFCSSLALEIDGVAQVAAVYDPSRRELFTAERGNGAMLNGRPMHVSTHPTLLESVLVTGFPYDVHMRVSEIVGLFAEFVGRARAVRRPGFRRESTCATVAAGRLDGFWERDLNAWDIAGGALLVEEQAGRLRTSAGNRFTLADATSWPATATFTRRCSTSSPDPGRYSAVELVSARPDALTAQGDTRNHTRLIH
jgi:myo-inositol-1(or 4)-monophosphatase